MTNAELEAMSFFRLSVLPCMLPLYPVLSRGAFVLEIESASINAPEISTGN